MTRIASMIGIASLGCVLMPVASADGPPDDAAYYGLEVFCTAPRAQIMTLLNTPTLVHAGVLVCHAAGLEEKPEWE